MTGEQEDVREYFALDGGDKRFRAGSGDQPADILRTEVVKELGAVAAGHLQPADIGPGAPERLGLNPGVFSVRVAKRLGEVAVAVRRLRPLSALLSEPLLPFIRHGQFASEGVIFCGIGFQPVEAFAVLNLGTK